MNAVWMVYICGRTAWNLPSENFLAQVPYLSESRDAAEGTAQEIFERLCELNSWIPGWPSAPDGATRISVSFGGGKAWVARDKDGTFLQVLNVEPVKLDARRFQFESEGV